MAPMVIRELDAHLVNKIAAGEVIERPASLVKELIENSLDAQATEIEIVVENGGSQRICIIDNGVGMSSGDLNSSIKRHTTSKISSEDDLSKIHTLGFRGEALASITEVSRSSITSRSEESGAAHRIDVEGGNILTTHADGRRQGTTVDVRDLFFNTPARRKFLKSERTEYTHIVKTVKKFVLAYPHVHFKLVHGEKTVIDSPSSAHLRDVVAHIYTSDLAKSLLEVNAEGNAIKISGLVAPPDKSRTDRMEQHLFVNGRVIRDMSLNYAITRAYEGFISSGRFPITFLFITIDPEMIDVNVHPKKEEVRFSNPALVQSELKRAVSNALISHGVIPSLKDPKAAATGFAQGTTPTGSPGATSHRELSQSPQLDLKSEYAERAKQYASHNAYANTTEAPAAVEPVESQESGLHRRVIGQLHGTYIVIQTEDGIELIDQHVAHERILYEKILTQLSEGELVRQKLLIPMSLQFPPDQAEILERNISILDEKLGIGIEPFGNGTFILRDWPESLTKDLTQENVMETLERLIDNIENESDLEIPSLVKELAADLSCKGAVVKNTPLTREEMESLVIQLQELDNPYRCPHGRPITVSYSLIELERAFGRR